MNVEIQKNVLSIAEMLCKMCALQECGREFTAPEHT